MWFRILGPLEADDPPVALGGGRARALLAVLLLGAGRVVPRGAIVDALWGEDVPDTASKMVQIHVSQLRKALPDGLLLTRHPGYALVVSRGDVDLHRAEDALPRARALREAGDHAGAAETLVSALALWRGPALAEFDEPFARTEAARIAELRTVLTEERIDADLALGRHESLVGELEVLVAADPLRERPVRQLMLTLHRSGRPGDALDAYRRARAALDEIGLEPSPALRALERGVLTQDPGLDAPGTARRPRRTAARRTTPAPERGLVGRTREWGILDGLLSDALAGTVRVAVISGEGGLGKTTLADALADAALARHDGLRVARGQCLEQHGAGEAYMPVLEALGRICARDPAVAADLVAHAPMWMSQLPAAVPPDERVGLEAALHGATPSRMLREGVGALAAVAADRPLLLVLEDLHWSDASTVDLLAALARRREPARLRVVATLRPDDAAAAGHPAVTAVADLTARGLVTEVPLRPLDAADVGLVLAGRLPGAAVPPATVAEIHARSGGNPLHVEKAIDGWVAGGRVRRDDDGWLLDADPATLAADIPRSLRDLLRERLRQVPTEFRDLVDAAAVADGAVSAALVAAVAGRDLDATEDGLERLARAGLVLAARGTESWPDGTVASRYAFTHDLCRAVAYDDLAAGRRARLHLQAAARLRDAWGDRSDEVAAALAAHLLRGGDAEGAVPHLLVSGRRALDRQAHREALDAARTGLRTLEGVPGHPRRDGLEIGLQALVGLALVGIDGWASAEAEDAFVRCRDLAARRGRPDELGWALHRLASMHEVRGDYPSAEALMEEAISFQEDAAIPGLSVDAHDLLACSLFHQGVFDRALHAAERGLSLWDGAYEGGLGASFGESPGVSCNLWAALSLWFLGDPDAAAARAAESVALADALGGLHARVYAHAQVSLLGCISADPGTAVRHGEAAVNGANAGGFDYRAAVGLVARGWGRAADGDHDAGLSDMRRGIVISRATGARMDDAFFMALLADALIRAGRVAEARTALEEAAAGVPRGGRFFWEAEIHRLRGALLVAEGRAAQGEDALRHALDVAERQGSPALAARAREAPARPVS